MAEFSFTVKAIDQASSVMQGISQKGKNAAQTLESNWVKIGAVTATVGGGMMHATARAEELNAGIRGVAMQSDLTEKELRDLALAVTDHTFSNDDAVNAMERLTKSGITQGAQFEKLLPVFDTYADATGKDIVQGIDEFDRVLSALGIPLEEAADHMDTMTFLSERTTVEMGSFTQLMRREAPAIKDMGLSLDDAAIAMAALEAEGIRGPRAVMKFQEALAEADGDINKFHEALGVSTESLETQAERLGESAGITEELADINNASLGTWDKMKKRLDDVAWSAGSSLERFKDLGPALIAVGPAIKGVSMGIQGARTAMLGLNAALFANPIGLVVIALAALAAGIVIAYRQSETFRDIVHATWATIQNVAEPVIAWLTNTVLPFFQRNLPNAVSTLQNVFSEVFAAIMRIVEKIAPDVIATFEHIRDSAASAISGIQKVVVPILNAIQSIFVGTFTTIADIVSTHMGTITKVFDVGLSILVPIVTGVFKIVQSTITTTLDVIVGLVQAGLRLLRGDWSGAWDAIKGIIDSVWDHIRTVVSTALGALLDIVMIGISPIRDTIVNAWNTIRDTTMSIFTGIADFFRQYWRNMLLIFGPIGILVITVVDNWDTLKHNTEVIFNAVKTFLTNIITGIRDTVVSTVTNLRTRLSSLWAQIENAVEAVWDFIDRHIGQRIRDARDTAVSIVENLRTRLATLWNTIESKVLAVWDLIDTHIGRRVSDARDTVVSTIENLRTRLNDLWGQIEKKVIDIWNFIDKHIGQKVRDARDEVVRVIENLRQQLSNKWNEIEKKVTDIWNFIDKHIGQKVRDARDEVLRVIENMQRELSNRWDEIEKKVTDIWNFIDKHIGQRVRDARDEVLRVIENVKTELNRLWDDIWGKIENTWNTIERHVREKVTDAKNAAVNTIEDAKTELGRLWDDIWGKVDETWNKIHRTISDLKTSIVNALKSPFEDFRDAVGSIMSAAGNKILDPIRSVLGSFSTFVGGIKSALNWIGGKLDLGQIVSGDWNAPTIPRLAKGGQIAKAGLAWVGEQGRELVHLPEGAEVVPNRISEKIAKGVDFDDGFMGKGGGIRGLIDTVSDIGSSAWDTFTDWIDKGADWVIGQAFDRVGLSLNLPGDLSGMGREILSKVKSWATTFVRKLLDGMQDELGAMATADVTAPSGTGWRRPTSGPITQRFAQNLVPGFYGPGGHMGIDIGAQMGTPVYASNAGAVSQTVGGFPPNTGTGWGNYIRLAHQGGIDTIYAHLLRLLVRVGQVVRGGSKIGEVDNTGASTGSHLHFEVQRGGRPVNPESFVRFGQGGMATEPTLGVFGENRANNPEHVQSERRLRQLIREETQRLRMPEITVNVQGAQPGDVQREIERVLRKMAHKWGFGLQ